MIDREKRETSVKEVKYSIPLRKELVDILYGLVSFALAVMSVVLTIRDNVVFTGIAEGSTRGPLTLLIVIVLGIMYVVLLGIQIYSYKREKTESNDCKYYEVSNRISEAVLVSLKRVHFQKTMSILQSTYGHVPEWHRIDYTKNILEYDIHQQLRMICIRLKELVVSLSPDFNDDTVTVDMMYSYPVDKEMLLDTDSSRTEKTLDKSQEEIEAQLRSEWRLITSGDHTTCNTKVHSYLMKDASFYKYMEGRGYVFCNDKKKLIGQKNYISSNKDQEYDNQGSVVGVVIELKNDQPEKVFVRLYLTITTYGRKLVEQYDDLNVVDFEEIFKENVLSCYKTLIESELAQMFIRHGIRKEYINPTTGGFISKDDGLSKIMNEIDEVVDAL